jgi:methylphosphotriester-DNA--protein-cysteine methyltransferase
MSEDLLRQVAADLNFAPGAAERAARMAALVDDNNQRIADAALEMPFDSSPYAFSAWLAATDAT